MWLPPLLRPFRVLRPYRAIGLDAIISLLRGCPGVKLLQSRKRPASGVPLFVMMPLDFGTDNRSMSDEDLRSSLKALTNIGVHGIMVDVWWGVCEPEPGVYNFDRYIHLAEMCKQLGLKMQAVMSFHACGGNVGDDVNIPLPQWVLDAGDEGNAWFRDRTQIDGIHAVEFTDLNREYLSFAADNEAFLPRGAPPTPTPSANGITKPDEQATGEEGETPIAESESIVTPPIGNCNSAENGGLPPQAVQTTASAENGSNAPGPGEQNGTSNETQNEEQPGEGSLAPNAGNGETRAAEDDAEQAEAPAERSQQSENASQAGTGNEAEATSTVEESEFRTPLQAYKDFVKAFCKCMSSEEKCFLGSTIVELQVGMGPCGELRYPSYPLGSGKWKFPGIGEYQCYDPHMLRSLAEAVRKSPIAVTSGNIRKWLLPPDKVGTYKDTPFETEFFTKEYKTEYGHFFQEWYANELLRHGEDVLSSVEEVIKDLDAQVKLSVKISGIHWWYFTKSRAAESTAGYYVSSKYNFYKRLASVLKEYSAILNFTCLEMRTVDQPIMGSRSGPKQLVREVFRIAAKAGVPVAGENALECYDWRAYSQVLAALKWTNALPHSFTLLRMTPALFEEQHMENLSRLVKGLKRLKGRVQ